MDTTGPILTPSGPSRQEGSEAGFPGGGLKILADLIARDILAKRVLTRKGSESQEETSEKGKSDESLP